MKYDIRGINKAKLLLRAVQHAALSLERSGTPFINDSAYDIKSLDETVMNFILMFNKTKKIEYVGNVCIPLDLSGDSLEGEGYESLYQNDQDKHPLATIINELRKTEELQKREQKRARETGDRKGQPESKTDGEVLSLEERQRRSLARAHEQAKAEVEARARAAAVEEAKKAVEEAEARRKAEEAKKAAEEAEAKRKAEAAKEAQVSRETKAKLEASFPSVAPAPYLSAFDTAKASIVTLAASVSSAESASKSSDVTKPGDASPEIKEIKDARDAKEVGEQSNLYQNPLVLRLLKEKGWDQHITRMYIKRNLLYLVLKDHTVGDKITSELKEFLEKVLNFKISVSKGLEVKVDKDRVIEQDKREHTESDKRDQDEKGKADKGDVKVHMDSALLAKEDALLEKDSAILELGNLPPTLFEYLARAQIPFERNAISNELGETVDPKLKIIPEKREVKIPYIPKAYIEALRYRMLLNLHRILHDPAFSKDLFNKDSQQFLLLSEVMPTLPLPPAESVDAKGFAEWNVILQNLGNDLTIWKSRMARGSLQERVLTENYYNLAAKIFEKLKTIYKADELESIQRILFGLRPCINCDEGMLSQALAHYYGEGLLLETEAFCKVGTPKDGGTLVCPVSFYVAEKNRKKTHHLFLLDCSASMFDKLEQLKLGLKDSLKKLAKRPGQIVTLITFSDTVTVIVERIPITPENLDTLFKYIDNITLRTDTAGFTALEKAFEIIKKERENDVVLYMGSDGIFNDNDKVNYYDDGLDFAQKTRALFRSIEGARIVVKTFFMCNAGIKDDDLEKQAKNLQILTSFAYKGSQFITMELGSIREQVRQLIPNTINWKTAYIKVTWTSAALPHDKAFYSFIPGQYANETSQIFLIPPDDFLIALSNVDSNTFSALLSTEVGGKEVNFKLNFEADFFQAPTLDPVDIGKAIKQLVNEYLYFTNNFTEFRFLSKEENLKLIEEAIHREESNKRQKDPYFFTESILKTLQAVKIQIKNGQGWDEATFKLAAAEQHAAIRKRYVKKPETEGERRPQVRPRWKRQPVGKRR